MAHLLWRQMAQITLPKQFHQIIFIAFFSADASRSKSKGCISASSMHHGVLSIRLRSFERICQRLNMRFNTFPVCRWGCVTLLQRCGTVRLRGAVKSYHCKLKVWLVEAQGFTQGLSGPSTHQHLLSHIRRLLWSVINCWAHFQPRCGSPQSPQGCLLYQNTKEALLHSLSPSFSLTLKSIYVALSLPVSSAFSYLSWALDHNTSSHHPKQEAAGKCSSATAMFYSSYQKCMIMFKTSMTDLWVDHCIKQARLKKQIYKWMNISKWI